MQSNCELKVYQHKVVLSCRKHCKTVKRTPIHKTPQLDYAKSWKCETLKFSLLLEAPLLTNSTHCTFWKGHFWSVSFFCLFLPFISTQFAAEIRSKMMDGIRTMDLRLLADGYNNIANLPAIMPFKKTWENLRNWAPSCSLFLTIIR